MGDDLERALGVEFTDRDLLELALTHRSYAFEAGGTPTNERLEFLGDAVVGMVVTDWIYRRFPDDPEGRLAKVRAAAVNTTSLATLARACGVGNAVRLGRGEELSGGRDKDSILADTFEALLGAIYLGHGMSRAAEVVHRLFGDLIEELATRHASLDFKTSLQELTAAELSVLPAYEHSESGPDHAKRFFASVTVNGEILGTGEGPSKKVAEQHAARMAYGELSERLSEPFPDQLGNVAAEEQA